MLKWFKGLLKAFWYEMTVSYKNLPDLEDIPPSGHGEWVRHPEHPSQPVEIKPVQIVSVRERAHFHKMRLEVLQDESWLNSQPVQETEPISISDIQTAPVQRDTEATIKVPAILRHYHKTRYER